MDSRINVNKSLPPLVDGKTYGYLSLTINNIIWTRRYPGNVTILVTWWGEKDSLQFKSIDIKTNGEQKNTKTYAIKTNFELFKEYLKNCETVELLLILDKNNEIIGSANLTNLHEILNGKKFIHYVPIYNNSGFKVGEIHVTLKLTTVSKSTNNPKKSEKKVGNMKQPINQNTQFCSRNVLLNSLKSFSKDLPVNDKVPLKLKDMQSENIYQSLLKNKHSNCSNILSKVNSGISDKLVAEVVARAQRLRGAMLNDSNDGSVVSDNLTFENDYTDESMEKEAALYEYLMGKEMNRYNEKKVLETLRTHSPTPSLIDFAIETIRSSHDDPIESPTNYTNPKDDLRDPIIINNQDSLSNLLSLQQKKASPLDYVDSVKILVDSLTLSSAGFRRVRSSCVSRGDGTSLSVTYFVQYEPTFTTFKKVNKLTMNKPKPVKMCSKKQVGQIVYFNHEAVFDLPKSSLQIDTPLKFKIFNRHLNQKTPTELGFGSMYISDAQRSTSLSATQKLAIVKKGIKIGELKVTVELGCDRIHFGKDFVEAVTSAKENIPVLELSSNSSITSHRQKTATGADSKGNSNSNNKTSAVEPKSTSRSTNHQYNQTKRVNNKETDEVIVEIDRPKCSQERILLHGLIYIGEGQDLPENNTYLICRAFWREDKAYSKVCYGTTNPFYHFHQLIPLIHGTELLERTKDNCIITEVYSQNQRESDNLIGIAKLSVHQLYVAYRDPNVLPHLLKSKYPIISVDGWVPISNPVSGKFCGQLFALVALGTADQIALLEMTRGLRDSSLTSQRYNPNDHNIQNNEFLLNQNIEQQNKNDMITQECQTEITTVNDTRFFNKKDNHSNDEDRNLIHQAEIVDRSVQTSNSPKIQTQFTNQSFSNQNINNKPCEHDVIDLDVSNSNSFSANSCNDSLRDNFNMPREVFRSVGVGAEYNEPVNQVSNVNYGGQIMDNNAPGTSFHLVNNQESDDDSKLQSMSDSSTSEASFRAVVEIDCALHLPKIETNNGTTIEPCTYVTFQKVRQNSTDRISSYMVTNMCPFTCNPKYNWRCDTKLSTDLLIKDEKRLIMKVWRLIKPEISMEINLEKDAVIGFSAIDLSVLTAGFPVISGWFHIIDFSGKCNGQLKVAINPLESIATFGKSNVPRVGMPSFDHSNFSSPFPPKECEEQKEVVNSNRNNIEEEMPVERESTDIESTIDIGLGLGEASMSFLSQSLKQKLNELDEIKQRLQSRLQDVTSTAFEDDFENDFDLMDQDVDEHDTNGNRGQEVPSWLTPLIPNHSTTGQGMKTDRTTTITTNTITTTTENPCLTAYQYLPRAFNDNNSMNIDSNPKDNNYPSSIRHSHQSTNKNYSEAQQSNTNNGDNTKDTRSSNGFVNKSVNGHNTFDQRTTKNCNRIDDYNSRKENSIHSFNSTNNTRTSETINSQNVDHPVRGTKVHINHLLDKLSTQLSTAPPPMTNLPMKQNIMELLSTLRRNNNNFSNDSKCNREVYVRTVPTQTDVNFTPNFQLSNNSSDVSNDTQMNSEESSRNDDLPVKSQKREKVSTVIRQELVADDQNETMEYDYLSARLITSNVRHMNLDTIVNPLLYPHILPDISMSDEEQPLRINQEEESSSPSITPEVEAVEQLDNRYVNAFNASINKTLGQLRDSTDVESTSGIGSSNFSSGLKTSDEYRVTPTDIPDNIDGNIDVTVVHKPCNDDLMASNSVNSTILISLDSDTQTTSEIDNSSLHSSLTSVSAVSRQAPDGGNPSEDQSKTFTKNNNTSNTS